MSENVDFTKIPILNIYYLLSYAWDKLEETEQTEVSQDDCSDCLSLLAHVLCGGTERLLKRGLDRGYVEHNELISRIRGKVDFAGSISKTHMKMPQLVCDFDEFDHDILHNQILKTTIHNLICCEGLEKSKADNLRLLYRHLGGINEIMLTKRCFSMVRLNRNNWYYDFLMKVCELVFDNLTPSEQTGKYKFQDFTRNHLQMASLYEAFVYNFYRKEQSKFSVKGDILEWDLTAEATNESLAVLPRMETDISLTSPTRKIIIDTKFAHKTLREHQGSKKVSSSNLYQIFAYVMNDTHPNREGMLLYPQTTDAADYSWVIKGCKFSVKTINLQQPWQLVHEDLLAIID